MHPEVFAVTDTVTCIRRPSYFTCSYVVRSASGVILIDAGMKSDGSDVLHALEVIGVEVDEVRAIFVTHWHNDHAAGAGEIAERSGARVVCMAAEAPFLRRETATPGLLGWLSDTVPEIGPFVLAKGLLGSAPMRAVTPTDILADGDELFGLRVIATPGHTDGHAAYYQEETQVLFAGDALAYIDGELRFMARSVTPDLDAARASMTRVLERPFRHVCPGHREPGPVDPAERGSPAWSPRASGPSSAEPGPTTSSWWRVAGRSSVGQAPPAPRGDTSRAHPETDVHSSLARRRCRSRDLPG